MADNNNDAVQDTTVAEIADVEPEVVEQVEDDPFAGLEDKTPVVNAIASRLSNQAADISKQLDARARYTSSLELFTGPLRALVNNGANASAEASLGAAIAALADTEDFDFETATDIVTNLCDDVAIIVSLLTPQPLDVSKLEIGNSLLEALDAVRKLRGVMFKVDDGAMNLAALAASTWQSSSEKYKAATVQTNRVVPSKTGQRGPGRLIEDRGFGVHWHCEHCGNDGYPASNKGSIQNDMAKHYASCHGGTRLYAGNPLHAGMTQALDAVLAPDAPADVTAQGAEFIVRRYQPVAA